MRAYDGAWRTHSLTSGRTMKKSVSVREKRLVEFTRRHYTEVYTDPRLPPTTTMPTQETVNLSALRGVQHVTIGLWV